jgi:putative ABC transport system permease protein
VGIAENIKASDLRSDPGLLYYLSLPQYDATRGGLYIRTRGAAAPQTEAIRRALQRDMPGTSYVKIVPLDTILRGKMRSWELGATMFTIFGALALVVAVMGLYSVVAYAVVQRTHEMGVRVALGAQRGDVLRLVVSEAMRLEAIAVVLGVALAAASSRWIQPLLFETSPHDPVVLIGVTSVLLATAAVASFVPALRAARVDPNAALRAD